MRRLPLAIVLVLTAAAVPLLPAPSRAESKAARVKAKMAFVDVERCLGETEDGLRAKASLKKLGERKQAQVAVIEESLKQQQQQLAAAAQSGTPPSPQLQSAAMAYQRDVQVYQDTIKRMNAELNAREEELFHPIERRISEIMARLAQAEGYDLIVDRKAMPIALKPELDLTERVIHEYNWGSPAPVPSARPAAPAQTTPAARPSVGAAPALPVPASAAAPASPSAALPRPAGSVAK